MPELPVVSARQMVAALRRLGFEPVRQRGSHLHLRQANRLVTVPMHRGDLLPGIVRSILRQARVTAEELRKAIR